ncbi:hypothetical protein DAEQUDRAFT_344888 [Daedalea quercina L-15889]|uniref:Uncharacterized protein n=1 Tax=Daedalea quercina L-15889 TaxID=1314783 RepID=A0A165PH92_9APHY|nr:hypothetical protein DAEQUDRAFT_344888 [Daedalea quercina L-15889]
MEINCASPAPHRVALHPRLTADVHVGFGIPLADCPRKTEPSGSAVGSAFNGSMLKYMLVPLFMPRRSGTMSTIIANLRHTNVHDVSLRRACAICSISTCSITFLTQCFAGRIGDMHSLGTRTSSTFALLRYRHVDVRSSNAHGNCYGPNFGLDLDFERVVKKTQ